MLHKLPILVIFIILTICTLFTCPSLNSSLTWNNVVTPRINSSSYFTIIFNKDIVLYLVKVQPFAPNVFYLPASSQYEIYESTLQYSTVISSIVLYCIVWYSVLQYLASSTCCIYAATWLIFVFWVIVNDLLENYIINMTKMSGKNTNRIKKK